MSGSRWRLILTRNRGYAYFRLMLFPRAGAGRISGAPNLAGIALRRSRMSKVVAAVVLGLITGAGGVHAAPGCDDFKAALIDGATVYQIPTPTFQLTHVNEPDSDVTHWTIVTFNEIRAKMVCWHGSVSTFAVDANNSKMTSSLHLLLLTGIGLHAYGLEWGPALKLRDDLVRAAKASDPHTANIRIQGGSNASFIISVAGVPSFQIDTER